MPRLWLHHPAPNMTDQTPEARLAAALHDGDYPAHKVCTPDPAYPDHPCFLLRVLEQDVIPKILAADATLAADLALAAAVREGANGAWFSVDALAAGLREHQRHITKAYHNCGSPHCAKDVIQAAKEAEKG